mmetsp:Transcript_3493/g.5346  ORF Transcript_3493/g.5346 Transcript_3493/m.5346 type:complete len:91 (-) Transcript_3493:121-393(-)
MTNEESPAVASFVSVWKQVVLEHCTRGLTFLIVAMELDSNNTIQVLEIDIIGNYLRVFWCGKKLNAKGVRHSELRNYKDGDCGEEQKWAV